MYFGSITETSQFVSYRSSTTPQRYWLERVGTNHRAPILAGTAPLSSITVPFKAPWNFEQCHFSTQHFVRISSWINQPRCWWANSVSSAWASYHRKAGSFAKPRVVYYQTKNCHTFCSLNRMSRPLHSTRNSQAVVVCQSLRTPLLVVT